MCVCREYASVEEILEFNNVQNLFTCAYLKYTLKGLEDTEVIDCILRLV